MTALGLGFAPHLPLRRHAVSSRANPYPNRKRNSCMFPRERLALITTLARRAMGPSAYAALAAHRHNGAGSSHHHTTTELARWSILNKQLPPVDAIKAIHVYDFDNTRKTPRNLEPRSKLPPSPTCTANSGRPRQSSRRPSPIQRSGTDQPSDSSRIPIHL